ncbi:Hypp2652 [Branchiostoma lanceolatum]|uniref:Hypp2652 protein n=1 Tax=Branchiostoma lanceolatum TaxID=7740 RepID=A0A8J9ZW52_BRALA|nr:Hypp2652 [Branchiostoma lanceolatum]
MGAESKTPKCKTPTTKAWNINIAKVPQDETLAFDYEDEEKSRLCGVKLRTSQLDKWIQVHKDNFDENFEQHKGTSVTWKSDKGTLCLSVFSSTAPKTGKSLLSIHFYHRKNGVMVQGQRTKWWADILYPEIKNNLMMLDKRTRSSAQHGAQRVSDAVNRFQTTCPEQPLSSTPCQTNVTETPIVPKSTIPRTLQGLEDAKEQMQQELENGAQIDDAITADPRDPPVIPPAAKVTSTTDKSSSPQNEAGTSNLPQGYLDRMVSIEKSIKVSDCAFSDLQKQYVDTIGKLNAFRDDLIMKEKEREKTHAKTMNTISTQLEAAQKALESHIRKATSKLQTDLTNSRKDLAQQKEKLIKEKDEATQEIMIERNLWRERHRDMSLKVDALSASNVELQDIIKKQDSEIQALVNRSKELEEKFASGHCHVTNSLHNKAPFPHDNDGSISHDNSHTTVNQQNNNSTFVLGVQTPVVNAKMSTSVNTRKLSADNTILRSEDIEGGVRIFADSLFRDVDPNRAFKEERTNIHRSSTITAAIDNISNIKDSTTKTVILHVGSNDLDNSKAHPDSAQRTLRNTSKLLETTKKSFPNARVAVSQVLQRGSNHNSALNTNIKAYNQEVLKLSKKSDFIYIKHRKLTQDRRLYLQDQIHLDPRSGTKLLVADVKRTLASPSIPPASPAQPPMTRPQHGHRPSGQHTNPGSLPTATNRDNVIPSRGGFRGQPFKNSANAVPLGPRITPSQPSKSSSTTGGQQVGGTQHVTTTSITTLQLPVRPSKQAALPWKEIGKRIRRAWDILIS